MYNVLIGLILLLLQLFDIGMEGGDQEGDGELLAETEEIAYECGPRQKFPLFFEESVPLQVKIQSVISNFLSFSAC